jgi:hypothetical protein
MITIPRSVNIYPGESTSVPYGEVVHIECQYGSKRINRTLYPLSSFTCNNSKVNKEISDQRILIFAIINFCYGYQCTNIPRSVNIYPGESTSVPYGEVVHIECQYGSNRINRTLYCSYAGNGMYSLQPG